MKIGAFFNKLKNPAVLMGIMMGGQAVAELCRKSLSDGKLTVGEAIDIVKKTAEVTGMSEKVIYTTKTEEE